MSLSINEFGVMDEDEVGDERAATARGRYLEKTTDLKKKHALAVAYRELGYSSSGTAGMMDTTDTTVDSYIARAIAQYGILDIMNKTQDERRDLSPVTWQDVADMPYAYRSEYTTAAWRNKKHVPDDILETIQRGKEDYADSDPDGPEPDEDADPALDYKWQEHPSGDGE